MWNKLYIECMWAIHNLVAHPISQILYMMSGFGYIKLLDDMSNFIHDVTVPVHKPHQGRG